MKFKIFPIFILLTLLVVSCSKQKFIRGTRILATEKNKEIIKIIEKYRNAMRTKDSKVLIKMAHKEYYQPKTDAESIPYGYKGLIKRLKIKFKNVVSVRFDIQYRKIHWKSSEEVSLEIYIDASYQVKVKGVNQYQRKSDYHKLTLKLHEDKWLFTAGI
jgi:hypothetical protein